VAHDIFLTYRDEKDPGRMVRSLENDYENRQAKIFVDYEFICQVRQICTN
jgi:hypothetical protein